MKRALEQPVSELTLFAGIFLKTWTVDGVGVLLPQHAHAHPHISFVVQGVVRIWCDEELLGDFRAPAAVKIAALAKHKFLTLTAGVVIACIHATEAAEIEIAAEHQLELED